VWFHALLCARNGADGCFVVFGPRAVIDRLVNLAAVSWDSLIELRADDSQVAQQVKAAWSGGSGVTLQTRMAGYLDDDGIRTATTLERSLAR
jgi:hypothetical protein